MTTAISPPLGIGPLLREWRQRRRLSQLELSLDAEVSARHLSFVETGRSKPSRELVLHLADHLDVPLRERNGLLMAAGYAPVYQERALGDEGMEPIRAALDVILAGHEPFPAVIVDRRWDLVTANATALRLLTDGVSPELLAPTPNALRVSLHPHGLAPRIRNLAELSEHLLSRLQRQIAVSADADLMALHAELSSYPGVQAAPSDHPDAASMLFVPMVLATDDGDLSLFSTLATFGTALDITVAELSIEAFFPADEATAAALRASAAQ